MENNIRTFTSDWNTLFSSMWMWTIFVFEGDCIVMCLCLHDGTVLHVLHAGCRWPQSPCGPVAHVSVLLTLPLWLGPANVPASPLSHMWSLAIIWCSPDIRACPPVLRWCHWSHSCSLFSRVTGALLLTDRPWPWLVFTAWWQESHYGAAEH